MATTKLIMEAQTQKAIGPLVQLDKAEKSVENSFLKAGRAARAAKQEIEGKGGASIRASEGVRRLAGSSSLLNTSISKASMALRGMGAALGIGAGVAAVTGTFAKLKGELDEGRLKSKQFESAITDLITMGDRGKTPEGIQRTKAEVQALAVEYNRSFEDMSKALFEFENQGAGLGDALAPIRTQVLELSRLTSAPIENLTSLFGQLWMDWGEGLREQTGSTEAAVARLADMIVTTQRLAKTNYAGMASYLPRISPVAKSMGYSPEQLMGLFSVATQKSANVEMAATGQRNFMGKITQLEEMIAGRLDIPFETGTELLKNLDLSGPVERDLEQLNNVIKTYGQTGAVAIKKFFGEEAVAVVMGLADAFGMVAQNIQGVANTPTGQIQELRSIRMQDPVFAAQERRDKLARAIEKRDIDRANGEGFGVISSLTDSFMGARLKGGELKSTFVTALAGLRDIVTIPLLAPLVATQKLAGDQTDYQRQFVSALGALRDRIDPAIAEAAGEKTSPEKKNKSIIEPPPPAIKSDKFAGLAHLLPEETPEQSIYDKPLTKDQIMAMDLSEGQRNALLRKNKQAQGDQWRRDWQDRIPDSEARAEDTGVSKGKWFDTHRPMMSDAQRNYADLINKRPPPISNAGPVFMWNGTDKSAYEPIQEPTGAGRLAPQAAFRNATGPTPISTTEQVANVGKEVLAGLTGAMQKLDGILSRIAQNPIIKVVTIQPPGNSGGNGPKGFKYERAEG